MYDLSDKSFKDLLSISQRVTYEQGDILLKEGEDSDDPFYHYHRYCSFI